MDDVALTKLICTELGTIAGLAGRDNGPAYTAAEVGIFYGALGIAPDKVVGVCVYGTSACAPSRLAARAASTVW